MESQKIWSFLFALIILISALITSISFFLEVNSISELNNKLQGTFTPNITSTTTLDFSGIGIFSISTEPTEAIVYVDDNLIGKSPIDGYRLPAGNKLVEIKKEGHISELFQINLVEGSVLSINTNLFENNARGIDRRNYHLLEQRGKSIGKMTAIFWTSLLISVFIYFLTLGIFSFEDIPMLAQLLPIGLIVSLGSGFMCYKIISFGFPALFAFLFSIILMVVIVVYALNSN